MIHTVYIDDSSNKGKGLLLNLQKERDVVRFENQDDVNHIPNGYISSNDFRASVKEGLVKKLKANGRL